MQRNKVKPIDGPAEAREPRKDRNGDKQCSRRIGRSLAEGHRCLTSVA
jgi:hypothetical protein